MQITTGVSVIFLCIKVGRVKRVEKIHESNWMNILAFVAHFCHVLSVLARNCMTRIKNLLCHCKYLLFRYSLLWFFSSRVVFILYDVWTPRTVYWQNGDSLLVPSRQSSYHIQCNIKLPHCFLGFHNDINVKLHVVYVHSPYQVYEWSWMVSCQQNNRHYTKKTLSSGEVFLLRKLFLEQN